ncbi:MAG: DUF3847 domain-containing protein, partial [Clostridiales bacterium]|nr:DUF3847 domain-containing protein [Clostridiales bacterium]
QVAQMLMRTWLKYSLTFTPETGEEMQAEIDYTENKIRQLHNQETALTAAYSKEERRVRTRRLCTEAGILEHYVPELKTMDERNTSDFIRLIACSEVAKKFLRMRGLRSDEVPTNPDTGIN